MYIIILNINKKEDHNINRGGDPKVWIYQLAIDDLWTYTDWLGKVCSIRLLAIINYETLAY